MQIMFFGVLGRLNCLYSDNYTFHQLNGKTKHVSSNGDENNSGNSTYDDGTGDGPKPTYASAESISDINDIIKISGDVQSIDATKGLVDFGWNYS